VRAVAIHSGCGSLLKKSHTEIGLFFKKRPSHLGSLQIEQLQRFAQELVNRFQYLCGALFQKSLALFQNRNFTSAGYQNRAFFEKVFLKKSLQFAGACSFLLGDCNA